MAERTSPIVIGIDGGGTRTRVMAVDFTGNVLAFVESGASSIHKDLSARQNARQAIMDAVALANREPGDVRALAAGIAGFDSEEDLAWVEQLTEVPGLECPKLHVNDAIVAHSGALMSEAGIIVISGTGSIIFAVTEDGRRIRNYDLQHYAASAARFIAYDAVYEALAGHADESDRELVGLMLAHFGVPSAEMLAKLALEGFVPDRRERDRTFGELAPALTGAALGGSRLAQTVCGRAADQIAVGVKMLGNYFEADEVKVSLIGSVASCGYMKQAIAGRLAAERRKRFAVTEPKLAPVAGAALLALKEAGAAVTSGLVQNIGLHPEAGARE